MVVFFLAIMTYCWCHWRDCHYRHYRGNKIVSKYGAFPEDCNEDNVTCHILHSHTHLWRTFRTLCLSSILPKSVIENRWSESCLIVDMCWKKALAKTEVLLLAERAFDSSKRVCICPVCALLIYTMLLTSVTLWESSESQHKFTAKTSSWFIATIALSACGQASKYIKSTNTISSCFHVWTTLHILDQLWNGNALFEVFW